MQDSITYVSKTDFLFENADFIRELSLLGSAMPILYKETFRGLYNHKILDISSMSMKTIQRIMRLKPSGAIAEAGCQ